MARRFTMADRRRSEAAGSRVEAPAKNLRLAIPSHTLARVQKSATFMEQRSYRSKGNINVRNRWRALEGALLNLTLPVTVRVRQQRCDYYFEIRDAVLEWAGELPTPTLRCEVETSDGLAFWIPKYLCEASHDDGGVSE